MLLLSAPLTNQMRGRHVSDMKLLRLLLAS